MNTHGQAAQRVDQALPAITILQVARGPMKNFNYLITDPETSSAVIVDPAWEMNRVESAIAHQAVTLKGVLVTHSHPDHIDLASTVASRFDCPIWMSREEIAYSGYRDPNLVPIDETPWTVGAMEICPLLTPGHTPGCTCFRIGNNLFTGDVLFAEGCGLCPDTYSAYAMFASLERLKKQLDPATRVFPGHSYGVPPGQTFARLLRDNMYLQFKDMESFAAFRLRSGQNRSRIFDFK